MLRPCHVSCPHRLPFSCRSRPRRQPGVWREVPSRGTTRARKPPTDSFRTKRRSRHQQDAVVPGFVKPEFLATFFFSALRLLVTVSIDLSGFRSVLNASFSKLLR